MSNLTEKIKNFMEDKYSSTPDIYPVIKELGECEWSKGKKKQINACKQLQKIAESDEYISNVFMKKLDKYSTKISEEITESINKKLFKPFKDVKD